MVTANKIPVPLPIAPIKSAKMVKTPTHIPPQAAAIGILFSNSRTNEVSLDPLIVMNYSLSFLATSLGPSPEISIQYLANNPHAAMINVT